MHIRVNWQGSIAPQRGADTSPPALRAGLGGLPAAGSGTPGLRGRHVTPGRKKGRGRRSILAPSARTAADQKKTTTLSCPVCSLSKIFKPVGGSRGVGKSACPHEERLWASVDLSTPLRRGARKPPPGPKGLCCGVPQAGSNAAPLGPRGLRRVIHL